MAYQGKSQFKYSIQFFEESLKLNPSNIAAMNNFANSLKALGNFERAKNLYEKIIDKDPNYIRAYNNLANLKTSYNDYNGAIELYKKAINILKKNGKIPSSTILDFMFSLAVAYQGFNKIKDSKEVIEKMLLIDPTHAGAHKLKSSMTKYSHDNLDSVDHLKQMETLGENEGLDHNKKTDLFSLGKAYEDTENFDKAYYYLNKANILRYEKYGSNLENEKTLFKNIIKIFDKINLKPFRYSIQKNNLYLWYAKIWYDSNRTNNILS